MMIEITGNIHVCMSTCVCKMGACEEYISDGSQLMSFIPQGIVGSVSDLLCG